MDPRPLLNVTIRPDQQGATIEHVLRVGEGLSRTLLRRLKAEDGIRLNGHVVPAFTRVTTGDALSLALPEVPSPGVIPVPMPLAIVHEDEHVVVIDKPVGWLVHPTRGQVVGTLANGLAHRLRQQGRPATLRPVHRLDRDTSGLVLFALGPLAAQRLGDPLRAASELGSTRAEGAPARRYLAWVAGLVEADGGVVDAPLARAADAPITRVAPEGQPARTRFRVLARDAARGRTLLWLRLATGRTHQIRAHLAHLGHPLVGDVRYGGPPAPRVALHAARLSLRHPATGAWLRLSAPLPPDWPV